MLRYCNTCLWLKILVGIGIQDLRNKQTGLNIMRHFRFDRKGILLRYFRRFDRKGILLRYFRRFDRKGILLRYFCRFDRKEILLRYFRRFDRKGILLRYFRRFDRKGILLRYFCVAHHFSFLYCVVILSFVLLRPVSYLPNGVIVSGLSILDCPFGFL